MPQLPRRMRASTPYLLLQATKVAARTARPLFEGEPLRFPHYVTLAWLAESDASSQRALAAAMGADPSDLVTVLDQLAEAGLVERTVDPADRRRRPLTITPAGHRWLTERDALAADYERHLGARLADGGAALRANLLALVEDPAEGPA
ncbi:MarR family winged helix-turn-helix transcriptional regulator [Cellulomonas sp. NPDC057328]|uniref:MarR family winged helix-turn-helix transcriptional regulator n=1 Tax=Cellulomonas sp. NPDC057328 TaxID=3346101 RepID=UPI00363C5289